MIYREVPSSTILPLSSQPASFSFTDLENYFDSFFYQQGQQLYNEYRKAYLQSNSTFLKDLFKAIKESLRDSPLNERDRFLLSLLIDSLTNQILILEEFFKEKRPETLNAIISGILIKKIKKIFS